MYRWKGFLAAQTSASCDVQVTTGGLKFAVECRSKDFSFHWRSSWTVRSYFAHWETDLVKNVVEQQLKESSEIRKHLLLVMHNRRRADWKSLLNVVLKTSPSTEEAVELFAVTIQTGRLIFFKRFTSSWQLVEDIRSIVNICFLWCISDDGRTETRCWMSFKRLLLPLKKQFTCNCTPSLNWILTLLRCGCSMWLIALA